MPGTSSIRAPLRSVSEPLAAPGSSCPQLHRAAATTRRRGLPPCPNRLARGAPSRPLTRPPHALGVDVQPTMSRTSSTDSGSVESFQRATRWDHNPDEGHIREIAVCSGRPSRPSDAWTSAYHRPAAAPPTSRRSPPAPWQRGACAADRQGLIDQPAQPLPSAPRTPAIHRRPRYHTRSATSRPSTHRSSPERSENTSDYRCAQGVMGMLSSRDF
jgi:hypothetical protein